MTDEQLNKIWCLVVISWERPRNRLASENYMLSPLSTPPIKNKNRNRYEVYFTDYLGNVLQQIKTYKHPDSEVRIYDNTYSPIHEGVPLIAVFPKT